MITLYGIPNCVPVKKARQCRAEAAHELHFHDFKKAGVPAERLPAWVAAVGWERLLNRQGKTWRQLPPEAQAAVGDAESAMALMQAQPSVIKRPVVEWADGSVTVGFSPAAWAGR